KEHLVSVDATVKEALILLENLGIDAILFAIDKEGKLIGSLTDGDVRRGLLKDFGVTEKVSTFIQPNPKFIRKGHYDIQEIIAMRENNYMVIPVINSSNVIINVLNFRIQKSYLPVDAIVMAGGLGSRLKPLTDNTPKPLLKVGDKTIIDHNIDRLRKFGVDDYWISVRYLGEQLENHFQDGSSRNISVDYVWEDTPLGTIGAVGKIDNLNHDYILVTNSDILTTLNYEDFFLDFIAKGADMAVITIPYQVNIPYAVMETQNNQVLSFKEKPTYTYYSNGGIYLIKKEVLNKIPKGEHYNSTDLMEQVIADGGKLISYPIREYWLDIGRHEDFNQAQEDIKNLKL
ncbi:MAG: nucleotidyltransferase family protein, partial [Salibacteraceae bacterium]